jgi:phenylacetate-coenzyme A ligase PaaK-like adenylate-forming protein
MSSKKQSQEIAMAIRKTHRIEWLAERWESLNKLPPKVFEARMVARLQTLINWHCSEAHNGAYRQLLDAHGCMIPPRIISCTDVGNLPIVDKSFISRSNYAKVPAVKSPVVCVETSGTTSSIVRVPHNLASIRTGLGDSFLRSLALGGLDSRSRYWTIGHRVYPGQATGSYLSFDWLAEVVSGPQLLITSTVENLDQQIKSALTLAPHLVASSPGFITRLAKRLLELGEQRIHPQVVLYGGAALTDEGREMIMKSMRPRQLVAFYPTTDCGPLGVSPPDDNNYRVFSETHYIEVVDPEGQPVRPGERGAILATALENRAAPLIRYRVGDEVTLLGSEGNRLIVADIVRRGEVSLGDGLLALTDIQSWPVVLNQKGYHVVACQLVVRRDVYGIDQPIIRVFTRDNRSNALSLTEAVHIEFTRNYQLANGLASGVLNPAIVELFGEEWSATVDKGLAKDGAPVSLVDWFLDASGNRWKQAVIIDER